MNVFKEVNSSSHSHDENPELNTHDTVVLITGSTDGIGRHTANKFAALSTPEKKYILLIHGRDEQKVLNTCEEIQKTYRYSQCIGYVADFSSMDEVRKLADKIILEHHYIDILILNAGTTIFDPDPKAHISQDEVELTFAVCVLSHYMLACRLLKLLSAVPSLPSRLLFISSDYQVSSPVNWENVVCNTKNSRMFDGNYMYQVSKTADAMLAYYFASRIRSSSVVISTCTPGVVATNLGRKFGLGYGAAVDKADDEFWLATLPFTGTTPDAIHGKYFSHRHESETALFTYDMEEQQKLIDLCEKITQEHLKK